VSGISGASTDNGRGPGRPVAQETLDLMDGLYEIAASMSPITVRGAFYQATTRGLVAKTEPGYRKVQRVLVKMREQGRIPWHWVTDHTRVRRGVQTYDGLEDALGDIARVYRRDLWTDSDVRVEVWLEKDALAGVVQPVTTRWAVDLMVTRGYPSLSYLHAAAGFAGEDQLIIYYLGDYDPSGRDIPRVIDDRLYEFGCDFTLHLLAVTVEQIEEWQLPTRPTKRSDTRARYFGDVSVELDAVPPPMLRELVDDAISQHIDLRELKVLQTYEREERELLHRIASGDWRDSDGNKGRPAG
jgi:hypothetical protein